MPTKEIHGWDILERKSKTSDAMVFLVYRVVHPQGCSPRTEYMRNPGVATATLRQKPSTFRSREAAERAIAKAQKREGGKQRLTPTPGAHP